MVGLNKPFLCENMEGCGEAEVCIQGSWFIQSMLYLVLALDDMITALCFASQISWLIDAMRPVLHAKCMSLTMRL